VKVVGKQQLQTATQRYVLLCCKTQGLAQLLICVALSGGISTTVKIRSLNENARFAELKKREDLRGYQRSDPFKYLGASKKWSAWLNQ
jgi:hypothetical protein